jgi:glucan phosphoethanolaminetransferase (alkaline phosphatase superfamily)
MKLTSHLLLVSSMRGLVPTLSPIRLRGVMLKNRNKLLLLLLLLLIIIIIIIIIIINDKGNTNNCTSKYDRCRPKFGSYSLQK